MRLLFLLFSMLSFCLNSNIFALEISNEVKNDLKSITKTHYGIGYEQRKAILNEQNDSSLVTNSKVSILRIQKPERPMRSYRPQRPVRPGR